MEKNRKMSFQIAISPNRRAAARFIGKVRRALQWALIENPDIKRTQIANELGVHRSVITRQLNGRQDMSLGRVAELAWAMGYEPDFILRKQDVNDGSNHVVGPAPASVISVSLASASRVATKDLDISSLATS